MFGQRLRLARKRAGLSMRELAKRMEPPVSVQAISKYEAGKMMPSSAVLVGLGRRLDVSLDFLMGGQVMALEAVEFRKDSRTSARVRARTEALVTEKIENYIAIEDILDIEPQPDPFEDLGGSRVDELNAVDFMARELRDHWDLGLDPIPSMTGLLETKGVKILEADLPERVDSLACTVKLTGNRPNTEAVITSRNVSIERKRFNLAHELAHRVIHDVGPALKKEKAMHRFAGAFLVPAEHLRSQVGETRNSVTNPELFRVKRYYGVSASSMLIRLREAGVLSEADVERAFRGRGRLWRKKEPDAITDNEVMGAFEKPQRFENLVWRALGEQLISPVRGAQLLTQPLNVVEESLREPRDSPHR